MRRRAQSRAAVRSLSGDSQDRHDAASRRGEAWIAYNKTSDVSPCALQFSAVVFSFVTFVNMNSSRSEPLKGRGLEVW